MLFIINTLPLLLSLTVPSGVQELSDLITPEDTRIGDTSVEEAVATYGDMVKEMEKPLKATGCPLSQVLQGTQEEGEKPGSRPMGSRPLMDHSLSVFVSFSMSVQDLKSLYQEVQKVGGRLLIKGLHQNSWKGTAHKLTFLKITVDIDPEAFKRYHITSVPQFVLQGVSDTGVYDTLKGNVSLRFALETFSSQGTLKEEALKLLKKLRAL